MFYPSDVLAESTPFQQGCANFRANGCPRGTLLSQFSFFCEIYGKGGTGREESRSLIPRVISRVFALSRSETRLDRAERARAARLLIRDKAHGEV